MASWDPQDSRSYDRSNYTSKSKRASRSARPAQSGRIASKGQISSSTAQRSNAARGRNANNSQGFVSAYNPGSQGSQANNAFSRQTPNGGSSQYSRSNPEYSKARKKSSRGKKIAVGVLAAVLVMVLGIGSAFGMYMNTIDQEFTGSLTPDEWEGISDALVKPTKASDPFYVLLIGSDARSNNESMGQRSDTNILAYIDPQNHNVSLLSIPRDTKIEMEGYGIQKFNAAYAYKGAQGAIEEASKLCNVDIAYYAEVSFEGLEDLVDAIGGVDIEVPFRVNDSKAGKVTIEEGEQHLDGQAALTFARTRQFVDGDFTRTSNQRLLMEGIIKRIMELNAAELPGAIQQAASCVTTDFKASDIASLALQFKDFNDLKIYTAMIPSDFLDISGISYAATDLVALDEMIRIIEEGGDPTTVQTNAYIDSYYKNTNNSLTGETS